MRQTDDHAERFIWQPEDLIEVGPGGHGDGQDVPDALSQGVAARPEEEHDHGNGDE